MPHKHPDTERWGGPGAADEDRTEPKPSGRDPRPPGTPTNSRHSQVSGGGGERDIHHSHDPKLKRDFEDKHPRSRNLHP